MIATIPHKINIGLHVIEKMRNGFHKLETLFYPCSFYADRIEIKEANTFSFKLMNADFEGDLEQNLVVKAYRLLQKDFDLPPVKISLTKFIPSGSGLGGGSADSANTLLLLNTIFDLRLTRQTLHNYASQLGSDTAFFLYDSPMFATGRGEILEPFSLDLSKYNINIVCPKISVSTTQAYSWVIPKRPKTPLKEALARPVEEWKDLVVNDFEEVVFQKYPLLQKEKEKLYAEGAIYASLTGSGSALFGIF